MKIVVATSNAHKFGEITSIFDSLSMEGIELVDLGIANAAIDEPEESGITFAENARIKAVYYAEKLGLPCLADDSGLCVDTLNGEPGIYSSRYAPTDAARIEKLLGALLAVGATHPQQRSAKFVCAACIVWPNGNEIHAYGECKGQIAGNADGVEGFGYDPVFYVPILGKTFGKLTPEEKNTVSHRAIAMRTLFGQLAAGV